MFSRDVAIVGYLRVGRPLRGCDKSWSAIVNIPTTITNTKHKTITNTQPPVIQNIKPSEIQNLKSSQIHKYTNTRYDKSWFAIVQIPTAITGTTNSKGAPPNAQYHEKSMLWGFTIVGPGKWCSFTMSLSSCLTQSFMIDRLKCEFSSFCQLSGFYEPEVWMNWSDNLERE